MNEYKPKALKESEETTHSLKEATKKYNMLYSNLHIYKASVLNEGLTRGL